MRKIVFHKLRATFEEAEGLKINPSESLPEIEEAIVQFEKTPGAVLNVLSAMVTGWRTSIWADEVEFEFVGEGWSESTIMQAKNRARPVFLRDSQPC